MINQIKAYGPKSVVLSLLFSTIAGCASYEVQHVDVKPVESYINKQTISDVTIAVDPFDDPAKSKSAFYVDLTEKNIKPLHIVIDNNAPDSIMIIRQDIVLTDSTGNEIQPVNSNYVFNQFDKNELLYGIFGFGIFSYMSAEEANEKMKADWYEKELPEERVVASKRKASGFVFFELIPHLKGKTVMIDAINLKTNEPIKFEIPIY